MKDDENVVDGLSVLEAARSRWLSVTEIITLLTPWTSTLSLSSSPPTDPPPSGTLLLYDQSVTRNYMNDGCDWTRRRKKQVKLRIGGQCRVAGCYVRSITTPTFHRREYHMLVGSTLGESHERKRSLVLLHYLDTEEALAVGDSFSDPTASPVGRGVGKSTMSGRRGGRKRCGLKGRNVGRCGAIARARPRASRPWTLKASRKASEASRKLQEQAIVAIAAVTELREEIEELEATRSSTDPAPLPVCAWDLKDSTLETLWEMVVEDEGGYESALDSGSKESPSTGIQKNLTPIVGENLVNIVEEFIEHR